MDVDYISRSSRRHNKDAFAQISFRAADNAVSVRHAIVETTSPITETRRAN
jgi:hypothetical protein